MRGRATGHDFVDPMILDILKESKIPMSILGINYRINGNIGKTVNINAVRNHLLLLVKSKKISENLNKENGVTYYKLIL